MNILNKKIGIVGGGQLGKMMILEAKRLGFFTAILDPAADCPAHSISDEHTISDFSDIGGYIELAEIVGKSGVITYEFEHINADALERLEKDGYTVCPSVKSLRNIQNKFTQKTLLREKSLPTADFAQVTDFDSVRDFAKIHGYPVMLKSATGGYDGKGNALIRDEHEIEAAFDALKSQDLFIEAFIDFSMEISVIAVREINGGAAVYPVAENIHKNSILDTTIVPARLPPAIIKAALKTAFDVMSVFDGAGTFCVEMFVAGDEIYINEVAPRPHNSGHYTIEGCFCNQFENHIRAITGLPLGNVDLIQPTVMVNLLGESDGDPQIVGLSEAYRDSRVKVHIYGKSRSKIGRKMGHFTVVDSSVESAVNRAAKIKETLTVDSG